MSKYFTSFLNVIEKVLLILVGIMLMVMTGAIFYQVILRYVFSIPNIWAEELTLFLFAWISLLGSAVAIRRNSHLRIEFFIERVKPKVRAILEIITYLLIFFFLAVVLKYSITLCASTVNNLSAGLRIPMAIPYSSITVGCIMMILFTIEAILKSWCVLTAKSENLEQNKLNV